MSRLADLRSLSDATAQHFGITEEPDGWEYPTPLKAYKRRKAYPGQPGPKYFWLPKGAPAADLVYNADSHDKAPMLYVAEGEPDCWTLHEAELPAVSFLAGAGTLPSETALMTLRQHMVEPYELRIVYDRDEWGEKGAQALHKLLTEHGFQPRVFLVPRMEGGKDISDLWLGEGAESEMFRLILDSLEEWLPPEPGGFASPLPDWLTKEVRPFEWVIEELFPARSVVLLAGHWSSGKSWLLAEAGISVATGRNFLGHFPSHGPSSALLLDQDSNEDDQRRRYANLLNGYSLNGSHTQGLRVAYYQAINIMDDRWHAEILAAIRHLDLKLIMIDALIRFHNANENSNTEMARVFERLREWANTGPCVAVCQHLGKPKEGIAGGHLVRGAGTMLDAADFSLGITAGHITPDNMGTEYHVRTLKPPRWGPTLQPFIYVVYGPQEGPNTVRYQGPSTEEKAMSELAASAMITLLSTRGPSSRKDLVGAATRATGLKERWADGLIKELVGESRICKHPKRGVYYLAEMEPTMEEDNGSA